MKRRQIHSIVFRVTLASAGIGLIGLAGCRSDEGPSGAVKVTSTAFAHGQPIPAKHTADGEDVSPPLAWSGLPEGTKELALICDDPDAPGGTWVHWVIYKIPAAAKGLPEGFAREARPKEPANVVQGCNSWSAGENVGYRGPSPPSGEHHYHFKLYALDSALDLEPGLDKASLLGAMEGHVLASGELMGTYRKR